ncbi:MAG TPA: hypothetical protein DEQ09_10645 [Bacteroidales bacterium]|nr:hypothetical protein [Bacteroidales bacterium]
MKKAIILLITFLSAITVCRAQTIDEVLWYSQLFYGGTARFQAMGGAFTALGGDLSVLSQNPAGLGVYRSMEISLSPQMYYNNTISSYNNTESNDYAYQFNLNQAGFVFPLVSRNNTEGLSGLNFAYSFNRTNNFNMNAVISGVNNNSSMADYWADIASGIYFTDLDGAAGAAFEVWILDTLDGSGGYEYATTFSEYGQNTNSTYGQTVRRLITREGYAGEHAFSVSVNYGHKLYVGATLGINKIESYSTYEHTEMDNNSLIFDFNNFAYKDVVETSGRGFSLKLGAIVRPVEMLRLGFAFHTPTVYRLDEYYYDDIRSEFDNSDYYTWENDPFRFSYTLTTPLRAMAGAAIQLGKSGMLSADYEFVDYRMARFSKASDSYDYYYDNQDIKDVYDIAHNIRLGGEFRLNNLYMRAGYAIYGSPFVKGEDNEDNFQSVYSAGLGLRQKNFSFDVSYALRTNAEMYFMYNHPEINPAEIEYNRHMVTATLGFRF